VESLFLACARIILFRAQHLVGIFLRFFAYGLLDLVALVVTSLKNRFLDSIGFDPNSGSCFGLIVVWWLTDGILRRGLLSLSLQPRQFRGSYETRSILGTTLEFPDFDEIAF
jgi:hypothetical protein